MHTSNSDDIKTQVEFAIQDALNSTTKGHTMDDFIELLSKPNVYLPDKFKDGLKKWDDTMRYDQIYQTYVVLIVVEKLLNHGKIQRKSGFGPDIYFKANKPVE